MDRRKAIGLFGAGIGLALTFKYGYGLLNVKESLKLPKIDQYYTLLEELTETIIPETDTPGAKSAKVADFIIVMYHEVLSLKSANRFREGLYTLEQRCFNIYGRSFIQCNKKERHEIISHFDKSSSLNFSLWKKFSGRLFGASFYDTLIDLTTVGFCTSKLGATQFLNYDFIPAEYQGCIPLKENQIAWATN